MYQNGQVKDVIKQDESDLTKIPDTQLIMTIIDKDKKKKSKLVVTTDDPTVLVNARTYEVINIDELTNDGKVVMLFAIQ